MGIKTKNLQNLYERKINTHRFVEIPLFNPLQGYKELYAYSLEHPVFSIRGDLDVLIYCLPFLSIDNDFHNRKEDIMKFLHECREIGCSLLVSDGKRYDSIQTANVVVVLEGNQILIDTSADKVPLRHMYRNPETITTYCGKVHQNVRDFERIGAIPALSTAEIERILSKIFQVKKENEKQFEMTVYPQKVGMQNEEIVFWQII